MSDDKVASKAIAVFEELLDPRWDVRRRRDEEGG